jgi:hypothetical protein
MRSEIVIISIPPSDWYLKICEREKGKLEQAREIIFLFEAIPFAEIEIFEGDFT